ncbi:MAG TPA: DUF4350 domain-containing protein [Burkholderiales bacterium]|nr:DUF4350 domain-containing protein [Burkholderiales bacterium]
MKLRILLGTVFLILVGLVARWFFLNFEYVDYREPIGMSAEAKRNPHLAAERLMTRLGTPASELRTLAGIGKLPSNGVLVIGDERDILTPQAREALLTWVRRGGHLITEDISVDKKDPLLDTLGVRREEVDDEDEGRVWPLVGINLPGSERVLNVQMHQWQSIERNESIFYARSDHANHVLHFPFGDGHVTVLNSMWFLTNGGIGKYDHAEFLAGLVRLAPQSKSIAFFNQPEDLSIWDWLLENAWAVLLTGALALALWLWQIVPRFGPIATDPQRERRSLLEHLRACGRFEWAAKGGRPKLVESAREVAWRRVCRAHPELALMSAEEARSYLAQIFGLPPEDIRRLTVGTGAPNENDFIRSMQVFQHIHEHLEPRANARGKIISEGNL